MRTVSVLPLQLAFDATPEAAAELGRGITDLTPVQLELLVRTDGCAALRDVRRAMPHVDDEGFAAAFKSLWHRGLLREGEMDGFGLATGRQLQTMALALGKPVDTGRATQPQNGLSMGLVWLPACPDTQPRRDPPCAVVIEDDPVLAKFLQCFLALEGFHVRLASNRAEVVTGFRTPHPPQLVLLDVMLPDADGFEVLRKLREHPRLQHVPVIMLTGCATREAVLQALSGGANGYLTKPFDAEVLARAVHAVTGREQQDHVPASPDPWRNADALPERASRRAA